MALRPLLSRTSACALNYRIPLSHSSLATHARSQSLVPILRPQQHQRLFSHSASQYRERDAFDEFLEESSSSKDNNAAQRRKSRTPKHTNAVEDNTNQPAKRNEHNKESLTTTRRDNELEDDHEQSQPSDLSAPASEDLQTESRNASSEDTGLSSTPRPARSPPQPTNPNIPWYLQVDADIPARSPHQKRQELPPLPSHSPPLLTPILTHISNDLGIDDLSILDLRTLDPPPALGANTVMIIGTARSEKHLHVSADRLCRHLRSEYKLSPFADGLLGRNELKLKIRRKAKRSRLLSAVGAKATGEGEVDDGIRTGWVCVNVGRVEGGKLPEKVVEEKKEVRGFVGFGTKSTGCRIVVQMMTEEKRGQIDLEALWGGILGRSKRAENGGDPYERKEVLEGKKDDVKAIEDMSKEGLANTEEFTGDKERYNPLDMFSQRDQSQETRP